ncbi:Diacylglycerol kinase [Caenorhabditis elegans]|uniref:Diacylglycerol kinase n=1 Tax=Caenorhabditis elegans TaxID=6239 RepID=Q58AU6_CAEEL|nr:Diacylglycerol kinase [Caenorhabditis elegans]CCD63966.1 Diacylglycerol kinase [Caenorhabditis elegans]|eukprot:NP_001024382.1 Diacylglycerol kinase [Caenorhabditis elegans]
MAAEGHNVDANLVDMRPNHGHYFVKKTFGKPAYCHHCCDKIWGMLTTGYSCEMCNFVCHEKCLRTVVSYCSSVALQLIKNPVAHTWSAPCLIKRKYCCVCRKRTDDALSVECEVCEYYVHVDCSDLAVSDCKEAATYVANMESANTVQYHHMREGNLPKESKCIVCRKTCFSTECLAGMRCEWCGQTAHAVCYRQMDKECDFGVLRKIMLPPMCLTIPRTELPMEQLLNISSHDQPQSLSSPSKIQADDVSTSGEDVKEREDFEIIRVFDGNNSYRSQDSLRRYHVVRFYVQEKEDPHDHAVFVGNLPVSLAQRQYERILLKLLGAKEKPFTAIGPIYFEYGSLIITFNTPKAATAAVQKLQSAIYEEKKLIVLCLPNVQPQMIPKDVEPLLVLVNVKSGGCQGTELIQSFRKLLNPFQVFDVLNGGPLVGLYVFRNIPKYKILACGGDGTIGWVLQCLDIAKQDAACFSPPCGIVPLGTGNDLARVLRWGGGYTGEENPMDILKDVIEADTVKLDRWAVVFHEEERNQPTSSGNQTEMNEQTMNNPEDQTSMIIMNNYFGIGIDADVCLKFHNKRDANPEKFQSRLFNKTQYAKIGLQKMFFERTCKDLWKRIELEVDGRIIELPNIEGIVVLNLLSWGSGANPWGTSKEEGNFSKPTHYDGLLEVVGISDVSRLGLIQSKLAAGIRIAQGGSIRITTHEEWPVQVDGEPHIQPPGTITILKSALKAQMLKKAKKSRRGGATNATSLTHPHPETSESMSGPLGVPSTLGDPNHGKTTPDNTAADSDEEGDAFL